MIKLYRNVPTLDLHGIDRDYAKILINDFINDNYNSKNTEVVIIHGNGTGIIKKTTQETLKKNKLVIDYKINNFNTGETLVSIVKKPWHKAFFMVEYQLHVNRGGVDLCTQKNMKKEVFHSETFY